MVVIRRLIRLQEYTQKQSNSFEDLSYDINNFYRDHLYSPFFIFKKKVK